MKPIPEHIIDQLLPEILEGNPSEETRMVWEAWLKEDTEHQSWFNDIKHIWIDSAQEASPISVDDSWKALLNKRNKGGRGMFRLHYKALSIAAGILLLMGLGVLYMIRGTNQVVDFALDQKQQVTLPDGSIVYSPGDAVIDYPASFRSSKREVIQKKGMAFFEVTRNPQRPFIIYSKAADIRVLGTSFRTQVSEDSTEVIVTTGKVAVYHNLDTVTLLPGEKVVFYSDARHTAKLLNKDLNYLYWKTAMLEYQDCRLAVVFDDLQSKLKIKIKYDANELKGLRLSGRYRAVKPEQVLDAIAETMDLKYKKTDDTYFVSVN